MREQPPLLKNRNQQILQHQNLLHQFDRDIRLRGYSVIAGIDEVGRGPLAGPVMAAAVILPAEWSMNGINDSKKLSEKQRNYFYEEIKDSSISIGTGCVSEEIIDRINILQSTYLAMKEAILHLDFKPDCLVIDAVRIPDCEIIQVPIIKGDSKSLSIAAASIVAKVTRDRLMYEYDKKYPQYGFAKHKGYGTKDHYKALNHFGPCPIHRKSFLGRIHNIVSI